MKRVQAFLLVAAALLLASQLAFAEPVGTFTKVEGNVDVLRQSDSAAVRVRAGDPVSLGDAIRTKREGKAEITFRDQTVLQLAPETRIVVDEYTYRGDRARERGLIHLLRGKVRALVSKLRVSVLPVSRTDTSFNVRTPTAIAGVKGTEFIISYDRGITAVVFIGGEGFVYNPTKPTRIVTLRSGQASFVLGPEEAPLDAQPVADSFVAPHLKDMPGSALETVSPSPAVGDLQQASAGSPGLDSRTIPPPAVVSLNSSYSALADAVYGSGSIATTPLPATGPIAISNPVSLPASSPGGPAGIVPVTQTYPSLLPTAVSMSVVIP